MEGGWLGSLFRSPCLLLVCRRLSGLSLQLLGMSMMGALYSVPVLFKQCRPCTMQTLHNADLAQCRLCTQCTLLKEIVLGASCGIISPLKIVQYYCTQFFMPVFRFSCHGWLQMSHHIFTLIVISLKVNEFYTVVPYCPLLSLIA